MPQDIEGVRKVQDYGWATWLLTFHSPYYSYAIFHNS